MRELSGSSFVDVALVDLQAHLRLISSILLMAALVASKYHEKLLAAEYFPRPWPSEGRELENVEDANGLQRDGLRGNSGKPAEPLAKP